MGRLQGYIDWARVHYLAVYSVFPFLKKHLASVWSDLSFRMEHRTPISYCPMRIALEPLIFVPKQMLVWLANSLRSRKAFAGVDARAAVYVPIMTNSNFKSFPHYSRRHGVNS